MQMPGRYWRVLILSTALAAPFSCTMAATSVAAPAIIDSPAVPQAIAQLPPGFTFAHPGELTVAIAGTTFPPLVMLADDDQTLQGSEVDIARLIADSLGLKLNVVRSTWEDWPLGIVSGKYDAVISNVTVTQSRKQRFDFASYRQAVVGFYVRTGSPITAITGPRDIAGLKIVVGSGTSQEKILLSWNAANEAAGVAPANLMYYEDQAAAQLALQSGRVDAEFGPDSFFAYAARTRGGIRGVGSFNGGWPERSEIAVTTRKGNGLVVAIHSALEATMQQGQYAAVLNQWGLGAEKLDHSTINPPGLPD